MKCIYRIRASQLSCLSSLVCKSVAHKSVADVGIWKGGCKKWTGRKLDRGSNYGNQKWTGLGLSLEVGLRLGLGLGLGLRLGHRQCLFAYRCKLLYERTTFRRHKLDRGSTFYPGPGVPSWRARSPRRKFCLATPSFGAATPILTTYCPPNNILTDHLRPRASVGGLGVRAPSPPPPPF